ncbi:NADH-quinone oxidoreductase subunit NuoB [Desulforamulus aeronauticus]|uniref:Ni,Fe-hydrogenase III small subunit n=1 Tax=Desulforamulus aeronauticus DSM 10349 TaxID=1121421 RepID=A0A1M6PZ00_9FIRM|nr:NADH-quinone oxidoreductase subunit NuoB [Desulforamulus aeronauticus]SHK13131.1 Ni,Fe-hydrogenase III small subunit [Desulforamulus aeronauticus DSM 10349]
MLNLVKSLINSRIITEDSTSWGEGFGRGLPIIHQESCLADCPKCENTCPTGALKNKVINPRGCIFCHSCLRSCPVNAITETEIPVISSSVSTEQLGQELRSKLKKDCRRSLHIRYVDAGSCNGCDFEINSVTNPVYDIQQYGIDFVASPRHADMLLVTGSVTRNLEIALQKTYEACPKPTLVVAVGACACGGGIFKEAYAAGGGVGKHLPVDVYVPGCPPTPALIIKGILAAIDRG